MSITGRPCPAIDPRHEKSPPIIWFQCLTSFESGFHEVSAFLDLFLWQHDAVDRILSATAVAAVFRPRGRYARHRRATRPVLAEHRSLRRLHITRYHCRPVPRHSSNLRCDTWLNASSVRLLGPYYISGNALRLRNTVGPHRRRVRWQLGWLRGCHQEIGTPRRYWNGHIVALCE